MGRRGEKPESKKKGTSLLSRAWQKLVQWDKALDRAFNRLTIDTLQKLPLSYYSIAVALLTVAVWVNTSDVVFESPSNVLGIGARLGYLLVGILAGLRALVGLLNGQAVKPLAFAYWMSLAFAAVLAGLASAYNVWYNAAPVLQQTIALPLLASRNWEDLKRPQRK